MSDIHALLARCRALGAELIPQPDGKLKIRAPAPISDVLKQELKQRKDEVIAHLTANQPYINDRGELIIPFSADPKYHWWKSGSQSIAKTLTELNAPAEVLRRYLGSYSETKQ